jgi:hypothetical protein
VRTNGGSAFTALNPRQPITPTPYAIYAPNAGISLTAASAGSVSATNIIGSIPLAQLPAAALTNGLATTNYVLSRGFAPVVVTVSAHGIADGYSTVPNSGAMLGIDTPSAGTYGVNEYLSGMAKQTTWGATNFNAVKFVFSPGVFFFTNGISFSNSVTFSISFEGAGEAATRLFLNSTMPQPLLQINSIGYDGTLLTGGAHVELRDLVFTALNAKHPLVAVTNFSTLKVENCGFFMWEAFTNTQTGANLSIYAGGARQMTNLPCEGLVGLAYSTGGEIETVIRDNQFFGLADGIQGYSDHIICEDNTFGSIGKVPRFATNLWASTDELSLGACFIGFQNISGFISANHIYGSAVGFAFNTEAAGLGNTVVQNMFDEGTGVPIAIDLDYGLTVIGGQNGIGLFQINGPLSGFTVQTNWAIGEDFIPTTSIVSTFDNSSGRISTSGSYNGNGSGLTTLNASAISTGTLPLSVIPSAITNVFVTASITNGLATTNYVLSVTGLYRAWATNIANLATSQTIIFTTPFPPSVSSNYAVSINFDTTSGSAISATVTAKTTNGFTIMLNAGIAGGATVDYLATPYQ